MSDEPREQFEHLNQRLEASTEKKWWPRECQHLCAYGPCALCGKLADDIIAELRAERDAANERAKRAEAALAEIAHGSMMLASGKARPLRDLVSVYRHTAGAALDARLNVRLEDTPAGMPR